MELAKTLESFFRDEITRAMRDQGLEPGTLTEHYLVQLLATYAARPIDESPLALKMLAAMEGPPRARRVQLREVGDTSLYVSGFWSESLQASLVDVDYYIGLGGSAYGELGRGSAGWTGDPYTDVFDDLARNFAQLVEVLMLVSRRTAPLGSNRDVLRLYERWTRTRSRWAARRLAAAGVVPPKDGGLLQ